MLHVSPSSLVHGNDTNPFDGGFNSGHIGGSHVTGSPVHSREDWQVRVSVPLRVNPGSQEKVHVPPTVCRSQSMLPFRGATSIGIQFIAIQVNIERHK